MGKPMASSRRNCSAGKDRRLLSRSTGPNRRRKSTAMINTPAARERSLERAAPRTPRAGTGPKPLMSRTLPTMFMQFISTETIMVSSII